MLLTRLLCFDLQAILYNSPEVSLNNTIALFGEGGGGGGSMILSPGKGGGGLYDP